MHHGSPSRAVETDLIRIVARLGLIDTCLSVSSLPVNIHTYIDSAKNVNLVCYSDRHVHGALSEINLKLSEDFAIATIMEDLGV